MGGIGKQCFYEGAEKHLTEYTKVSEISFYVEGIVLRYCKIFRIGNRYMLPIKNIVEALGGTLYVFINKVYISIEDRRLLLNLKSKKYKSNIIENQWYLSVIDIVNLFNMKIRWNYKNKTIKLYMIREKKEENESTIGRKKALLRFEDITAGEPYNEAKNLEKFRIIIDYLNAKGYSFHVAWIPRFIDPTNKIDNDISKDYSISNADFLFTLDYVISRKGIIGIHGYTHQFGNQISACGTEFDENINNDEESVRNRIERAVNTSKSLYIQHKFFQSPQNLSTSFQQSIIEGYFKYIFEPFAGIWNDNIIRSPRNRKTIYVPTTINYISQGESIHGILDRINNLGKGALVSLSYHLEKEFKYITLGSEENEFPTFNYSKNSNLHKIIENLEKNNYRLVKITSLKPQLFIYEKMHEFFHR